MAMVRLLLDAALDINEESTDSPTALMEAAAAGHIDVLKLLISRGADVNAMTDSFFEQPAIFKAAEGGHFEAVRLLLEAGSDLDAHMTFPGPTIRHALFKLEHKGVTRVLLEFGVNRPH